MFKTLRTKLIVLIALLMVVSLAVTQIVGVVETKQMIRKDVSSRGHALVEQLIDDIQSSFTSEVNSMKQFSESPAIVQMAKDNQESPTVEKEFQTFLKIHSNTQLVYIGTEGKKMYTTPKVDLPAGFDPTSRPWYKKAIEHPDEVAWTDPYVDTVTGKYVVTLAKAVKDGAQVVGVIGMDLSLDAVTKIVNKMDVGYKGYPFLFDQTGIAIVHPQYKGKNMANDATVKYMLDRDSGVYEYTRDGEKRMLYFTTIPELGWKVGAVYKEKDLFAVSNSIAAQMLMITIIAVLIGMIVIYLMARSIVKPIVYLQEQVERVAEGDLTVQVKVKAKDEIGQLASHFNHMVHEMRALIHQVNQSVAELAQSADHLSAVSEETMTSSEQVATAINDIAKGTSEQASDLDTINERTTMLSSQIEAVAQSASEMQTLSNDTKEASYYGLEKLNELQLKSDEAKNELQSVEKVMDDLVEKMKRIDEVIQTITAISAQTNLLALNASIEAARAGEHGKGFAVVAEEVRKLAEQSSQATELIRQTIATIQQQADLAMQAVGRSKDMNEEQQQAVHTTGESFMKISVMMEELTNSISHISDEVKHMNESKDQVVEAMQNISAIAQQAAASAEEVAASADDQLQALSTVTESAEKLSEMGQQLKKLVEKFDA
ncbi:methyl-accepting chemotaxis (MCP) signaling domain protein [Anoxybacillus sp. B7M1]|uniref:methyl-accepting chemotaxis protein n=1 Tax=unclassified Anoxybacillus TaxID=2639704 RepID=UPI0005CD44E4|nr:MULTISPECIES: methyl-accepting chemotaxis protein [unclassified Anoxybacillus]ANB56762.1 methyl-accepting chemotaxis (MCP) signaling domain protein [Anoxybacillus sp. B2M1]ANB65538.1 methyl-accepting chemotaxis (MCP) signaling domain protein [Anoxybacillus sp. B7M1]